MTLDDKIKTYLAQMNIVWANEDYQTAQPADGEDQIVYWSTKLGPEPTQAQLEEAGSIAAKTQYNANMQAKRAAAYKIESDPLFFKAQRGEATMQEWQDKVAEIKVRFPYQE